MINAPIQINQGRIILPTGQTPSLMQIKPSAQSQDQRIPIIMPKSQGKRIPIIIMPKNKVNQTYLKCGYCEKTFSLSNELKSHMKSVH